MSDSRSTTPTVNGFSEDDEIPPTGASPNNTQDLTSFMKEVDEWLLRINGYITALERRHERHLLELEQGFGGLVRPRATKDKFGV
ncbi:hypothetical protein CVT24_008743 [Panaeolus cyanescens]|uniref:Uncharacterized protein n=1 Tax=Panaeolus cyanescens TaxID=181874 RepID=A0A409VB30_9AGAR|nr:hypothetical protein CVT24_008743 [Panaeolus cyanescens]